METKELIDALRNEDETDVSAMMAYMKMAADRPEGMQKRISSLESAEPTLVDKSAVFEPWNHSAYVRAIIEWCGKTAILNIPLPREAVF